MQTIYLTLISILTTGTMLCSCGSRERQASDSLSVAASDSLPVEVTEIVNAVVADDGKSFSTHVNYPLERPYPLKDINDEKEMQAYYNVMVDDSLKNVIAKSTNHDWSEEGWRGWTVKDGQYLWVDGTVYEVNYLSAREKNMKDSLVRQEKASLPSALSKGWIPQWVMEDQEEGTVYRIDADSLVMVSASSSRNGEGEYRLSVYLNGGDLRRHPERVVRGRRIMEGSMGNLNYYFDDQITKGLPDSAEYMIEIYSETGTPRIYHRLRKDMKGKKGKPLDKNQVSGEYSDSLTSHDLKKIYWLDRMKKQPKDSTKSL